MFTVSSVWCWLLLLVTGSGRRSCARSSQTLPQSPWLSLTSELVLRVSRFNTMDTMWAENLMCYSANCWWKTSLNNIIKRQPYERVGLWSISSRFPFGLIPDWLHHCLHALLPVHCLSKRCCLTFQHPLCSQASHFIFCLFLSHQKVLSNIPVSFLFTGQSFYLLSVPVSSSIIQHSRVLCVLKPVILSVVFSCLIRRC